MTTPVIDRRTCEQLLGVKRRRANELMQRFSGYRSGNVYLVSRDALLRALDTLDVNQEIAFEVSRRRKLGAELATLDRHARAASVRLPVPESSFISPRTLPADISVVQGKLTVQFQTAEELFAKLYGLAEAAVIDFERIRELIENPPPRS